MILFSFVKRALNQLDRRATDSLSYQQLSRLEPRLLEDIGLKLEDGRVVELNPTASPAAEIQPPESGNCSQTVAAASQLEPEPQGGGG
ncbi:hypothetical protein DV711_06710 [Motiliproteus coralliicola]|uniref:DUF1127 domain-containing protein n=1 Tax=Motiliproteus coralliicola TaxID=2283196 RepID=A0A369WXH5_9GAMM|nr:hypothetical protein [Motiliproteus coralliicola]RDE25236.1 hypothetical protein DV711_06710 [Motiliproteus coralliicola]